MTSCNQVYVLKHMMKEISVAYFNQREDAWEAQEQKQKSRNDSVPTHSK